MLTPLVIGFTVSAVAVFALVHSAGDALRSSVVLSTPAPLVMALVFFATVDIVFPRLRPTLLRRQTPKSLAARFSPPVTGLLWGLDTGSVFSTFRASAASWGALVLTFAGWGPSWTGAAYAAGFCLPLAILVATYPVEGATRGERGWRRRSTESIVVRLGNGLKYVRATAVAGFAAAIAVVLVGAVH